VRNSVASQEFGSDYSDPIDVRGLELSLRRADEANGRWEALVGYAWDDSLAVVARPTRGRYEATLPAAPGQGPRLAVRYDRAEVRSIGGLRMRLAAEARVGRLTSSGDGSTYARMYASARAERPFAGHRLVLQARGGSVWSDERIPAQQHLFAGGPESAPGYRFHQFAGARLLGVRGEWQAPIPFFPIPLGRWGRIPGRASIVPMGSALLVTDVAPFRSVNSGWYPSVGLGLISFFELLRIEVARGLRGGRWTFNVDISRDFWRIM
jgi:hypothetical protein